MARVEIKSSNFVARCAVVDLASEVCMKNAAVSYLEIDGLSPVSNSLKPQRRFTISNLLPNTEYQLQVEAHNIAGASTGDFQFFTLTKDGGNSNTVTVGGE